MGKIDVMAEDIVVIKTTTETILARLESHNESIRAHDAILRGGVEGQREGLCEQVRNINKRNAAMATIIPFSMMALWEYVKHKMRWG